MQKGISLSIIPFISKNWTHRHNSNTIFADIPDSPTLKYAIIFHYLAEVTAAVSGAGLSGWGQCDIVRRYNAALMLFVALLRDILLGQTPD